MTAETQAGVEITDPQSSRHLLLSKQTPQLASALAGVHGTHRMEGKELQRQRRAALAGTVIPFLGFGIAMWSLWGWGVGWSDLVILVGTYLFTGFGVTIGFHRLLAHRSFRAARPVVALLSVAGSMAAEGPLMRWVATHRRHHAYSDATGDPHSPYDVDATPPLLGTFKGLWHAHIGWVFKGDGTSAQRWAPDLLRDPLLVRIDQLAPLWVLISALLPAAIGFILTGKSQGALTAFLWGGLARIFLVHHVTWSVNSICHFYGKRPFDTSDFSANNWALAVPSLGESWHNNHHAFPSSAIHGLGRWQLDISGLVILGLERLGLASRVKRPYLSHARPVRDSEGG